MSLKGKTLIAKKKLISEISKRLQNCYNIQTKSFVIRSIESISFEKYHKSLCNTTYQNEVFSKTKYILRKHDKEVNFTPSIYPFEYSSKFVTFVEQNFVPPKLYFYDNIETIITNLIFEVYPLDNFSLSDKDRSERLEILNEFCDEFILYLGNYEELIYQKFPLNSLLEEMKFPQYYILNNKIVVGNISIDKSSSDSVPSLLKFLKQICDSHSEFEYVCDPHCARKGIIFQIYEGYDANTLKRIYWYKSELDGKDPYLMEIKTSKYFYHYKILDSPPLSWLPYNHTASFYPANGSFDCQPYLVKNKRNSNLPEWTSLDGPCFVIFKFTLGCFIFSGFSFVYENEDQMEQDLKFEYSNDNESSWSLIEVDPTPKIFTRNNAETSFKDQNEKYISFKTAIQTNIIKISLFPNPEKENILTLRNFDLYGNMEIDTNQKFIFFNAK